MRGPFEMDSGVVEFFHSPSIDKISYTRRHKNMYAAFVPSWRGFVVARIIPNEINRIVKTLTVRRTFIMTPKRVYSSL